jgi:hypothetical protein
MTSSLLRCNDVCFGSSVAVDGPHGHVRFPPQSGPKRTIGARPLSAKTRHRPVSFDDFVGGGEQHRRHGNA